MVEQGKIDPKLKKIRRLLEHHSRKREWPKLFLAMWDVWRKRSEYQREKPIIVDALADIIREKYSLGKNKENLRTYLYKCVKPLNSWIDRNGFDNTFRCAKIFRNQKGLWFLTKTEDIDQAKEQEQKCQFKKAQRAKQKQSSTKCIIATDKKPSRLLSLQELMNSNAYSFFDDIAFPYWIDNVSINSNGDSKHHIRIKMINTSNEFQKHIIFPVFYDVASSQNDLCSWASSEGMTLNTDVKKWNTSKSMAGGYIQINFRSPLPPGKSLELEYGYQSLKVYSVGDNWFEWFFARNHDKYELKLDFEPPWLITFCQSRVVGNDIPCPEPKVTESTISWLLEFPSWGKKYRLDIQLKRRTL